jgi:hypothetical protein
MAGRMAGSIGGRTGPWPGRLVTWLTRLVRLTRLLTWLTQLVQLTRLVPWFARFAICLGVASLLINGTAFAERRETAAASPADGKVLGIAYVGRMVADLDKSVPFYETIGLTRDPSVDSSWRRDETLNHSRAVDTRRQGSRAGKPRSRPTDGAIRCSQRQTTLQPTASADGYS